MKFFKLVKKYGNDLVEKVKEQKTAAMAALGALLAGVGATPSYADVAFDSATKSFSGTFDLTPYYSAVGIIITAIAVIAGIRLAIRQFRSA